MRQPARMSRLSAAFLLITTLLGLPMTTARSTAEAADRTLHIVAFGDSLTAGYGLPGPAAFPNVLEASLKARGHKVEIANAGVSGDTASGGLDRLDWSVPDGADGVILELGANDMLRGTDPEVTRRALDTIIARLRERRIPVMLAGMYASRTLGADYVRRFETIYTDLAAKYGLVLYPFFLDGIAGTRAYTLPDGVHPSTEGVRVIVQRILPSVERFLSTLKPKGA